MKTKNNTRETIDNQVKRMVLRGSAVIFSLAFISLTLNANNAEVSKKLNNSSKAFVYETEQEESMKIEAWMTDESHFISTVDFNAIEIEKALKVEDWMINAKNFSDSKMQDDTIETEKSEIEVWMTDDHFWGF